MAYTQIWTQSSSGSPVTHGLAYVNGTPYIHAQLPTSSDCTFVGRTINKVSVYLKKLGSGSGTVYVKVFKSDGTEVEIGSKSVSDLTTSWVEYDFINDSNTYEMTTADRIGVSTDCTSTSNRPNIQAASSDPAADSKNQMVTTNIGSSEPWTDVGSGYDLIAMTLYELDSSGGSGGGSGSSDDTNATGMYEPPIQIFRRMNF
tara:strand:+ start:1720 stop:2325 length:606 start_codon:yes stop_codon:yes gene_type:complete